MRFKLGNTYLIKFGVNGVLNSITVLLITEQAYHICWNLGLRSKTSWESINNFHREYVTVEDITEYIKTSYIFDNSIFNINAKCNFCDGEGRIPDSRTTAMNRICPVCQGIKYR
jgi:hypothetical protein